jgi:hypothetical protein
MRLADAVDVPVQTHFVYYWHQENLALSLGHGS